jgi:glycine oxidase
MIITHGKRYIVPRRDGYVLCGSTEEPEAGFHKATTREAIDSLVTFARNLVPGLAYAEVETAWSGLRPGSIDGLPSIGPLEGWKNAYLAAGHFRAGVQLSLGTARLLSAVLRNTPLPMKLDAFLPGRTPNFTMRPAFRS